ncbi:hypothetical protein CRE_03678 [Caenorhabditis remanei]|uniref:Phytanoyl-CoA hydroxylase-interacting protein-like C-terminal domain-containing protein n=1 Tax=Caenorhabditis remanei TaxID=31234 RepID=E3LXM8_CAERE|nr:hypothetical protein CRE_03678 [Caenorhabditis remanei]
MPTYSSMSNYSQTTAEISPNQIRYRPNTDNRFHRSQTTQEQFNNGSSRVPITVRTVDLSTTTQRSNEISRHNPLEMDVMTTVYSEKIVLKWQTPTTRRDIKYVIDSDTCDGRRVSTVIQGPLAFTTFFINTTPGKIYNVAIKCKSLDNRLLIAKWSSKIRAELSSAEFNDLYAKCLIFIRTNRKNPFMQEFSFVYRCKPKAYWDQIFNYCNDIMYKYRKDQNGQPGNLINGKIQGLFFSARVLPDGSMPKWSYFGDVRMSIEASSLLDPRLHNFYFADFYCNKEVHYATIVICVKDSETDEYCRDKLIRLDPFTNTFIKLEPLKHSGKWKYYINRSLIVELFYTENLSLSMGYFSTVFPAGAGRSRVNGLPNNKVCRACNLYPSSVPSNSSIVYHSSRT